MQYIIWQQLINLQHNTYVHKSCIMMHNTMYSFRVQAYILIKSIVVDADHVFHPKQPLKDATTKKNQRQISQSMQSHNNKTKTITTPNTHNSFFFFLRENMLSSFV